MVPADRESVGELSGARFSRELRATLRAMKIWAAVATLVLGVAPLAQQADTTRNPLGASPDASTAGQRLYDQTCQSCHGAAGRGDRGPALDTGRFARGGADGDLFHTIRAGVTGSQMPPFAGLSDTQIWQLVAYIRSLDPARGNAVAVAGRAAEGESTLLRQGRLRRVPRSERPRRDRRSGPVGRGTHVRRRVAREARQSGRDTRRTERAAAADDRRDDERRTRNSRRPPQRGHVHRADRRRVRNAAPARQGHAAVVSRGQPIADAGRLRDKARRGASFRISSRISSTLRARDVPAAQRAGGRRRRRHARRGS